MRYTLSLALLLSGCAAYPTEKDMPEGMVLVEHHYTDYQELVTVCANGGEVKPVEACAFVYYNLCVIHLPLAWNGDPMYRSHEIAHCSGHIDPPRPLKNYFPY